MKTDSTSHVNPRQAADSRGTGIVYDAAAMSRILGLPCESIGNVALDAHDGEIVFYYGGWDLRSLRMSAAGLAHMWDQTWYDAHGWKAEPGYYRVVFRVPGTNGLVSGEQIEHPWMLGDAWKPTPVAVGAAGLLAHLVETGNDLLQGGLCACAETLPGGQHAVLWLHDGSVNVFHYRGDVPHPNKWLSAAKVA
jgi:hypothetical protein